MNDSAMTANTLVLALIHDCHCVIDGPAGKLARNQQVSLQHRVVIPCHLSAWGVPVVVVSLSSVANPIPRNPLHLGWPHPNRALPTYS